MSTVLYSSPVFGPIHSRRLGVSLGINLMPAEGKICTFDCIYCECGYNRSHRTTSPRPTRIEVATALEERLQDMTYNGPKPDVLTFAGNGEPTLHPDFAGIVDDVVRLRDEYFPQAKISVLSNATQTPRPEVRRALMRVDNNIQKLDTVNPDYIRRLNRPHRSYDVNTIIDALKRFHGHVIIQTMFLSGTGGEESIDNTGDEYVLPWIEKLKEIAPMEVMIYTIDRETPDRKLRKASPEALDRIVALIEKAGIPATASY
jgi:wyosine [tRNA(Phe)-imidazoG37] synthetase (radical SAM superfamily)